VSADDPSTVVSPSTRASEVKDAPGRLAITIVWHPDLKRVGARGVLGQGRVLEISRKTAPFALASDVSLSRSPFLELRDRNGDVEVTGTATSMRVDLDGQPLGESRVLSAEEVRAGAIFTFARTIIACLHRIRVPVLRGPAFGIVGGGDAIEEVRSQISRVLDLDVPVLVRGETGTGKELVARAIASGAKRPGAPFVAINMAAIPPSTATDELFGHERGSFTGAGDARPGYFVEADGGTLFLDEIGAASSEVQAMLLRVLETAEVRPLGARRGRAVTVRVIAATDEDLEAAVAAGRFSEPLYYRLAGYQILLPTLRQRREDIGPLFLHFLEQELALTGEAHRLADARDPAARPWIRAVDVSRIASAAFPGNVRQLRNVARRLVIANRGKERAALDATIERALEGAAPAQTEPVASSPPGRLVKVTDEQIHEALRRHNYNFSAAADDLGIHRSTLYDRVRQNPMDVRSADDLSEAEILEAHGKHGGDMAAMAAELRVSPKPLKARLARLLARPKE
jgi:two-component system nitrogen regulation response regulator GlnG